jgi:superfamily II DNA or RNA helicase
MRQSDSAQGGSSLSSTHVITLRPYQRKAVESIVSTCSKQSGTRSRVLYVSPTGSGKTVIAAAAIRRLVSLGLRVVFLAHTREIIKQTQKKLEGFGVSHGVLMARFPSSNDNAMVQVCSVQTLCARNQRPTANVIIVDEAHHASAKRYELLLEAYPDAHVIGITATPLREDSKTLSFVFDEMKTVALPSGLKADGYLSDPAIYGCTADVQSTIQTGLRGVKRVNGDYNRTQLGRAMNQQPLIGKIVDEWKRLGRGHRTVVFASSVQHSIAIAERFSRAGVKAEHIDGSMPATARDAILKRLDAGKTTVVSNFGVLSEGWDQPSVKCLVLARPTRSLTLFLQWAGRCLRPWAGKHPIIIDHALLTNRFGYPDEDREFSLHEARVENENQTREYRPCPDCLRMIPLMSEECRFCNSVVQRPESPEEINAKLELVSRRKPETGADSRVLRIADVSADSQRRFWKKVDKRGDDECWHWTGGTNSRGYGSIGWGPKGKSVTWLSHRVAFVLAGGEIDPTKTISPRCRNKLCMNALHLEQITMKESSVRTASLSVACKRGHGLSGDNMRIDGRGKRICLACVQIRRSTQASRGGKL